MQGTNIILFLVLCITIILSITAVSAFDFDNVKSYDEATKTVTITNALGLGSEIAKMKLTTPQINYVMYGKDRKVAEIEFINVDTTYDETAFRGFEFYNLRKSTEVVNREITYKYAVEEIVKIPVYEEVCVDSGKTYLNGSKQFDCTMKETGTRDEVKTTWTSFRDVNELPKSTNIKVGLFADVEPSDNVEWIPTFFGVRIPEWATWVDSMNIGLQHYYTLNGTVATDSLGTFNMTTLESGATCGNAGKIGNACSFDGSNGALLNPSANSSAIAMNLTISFWTKQTATENVWIYGYIGVEGTDNLRGLFTKNDGRFGGSFDATGTAHTAEGAMAIGLNADSAWRHWVIQYTADKADTFCMTVYMNGTYYNGNYCAIVNTDLWWFNALGKGYNGDGYDFIGSIDEVAIWNRSLTTTEISNLWNSGDGVSYVPSAPADTSPIVTLNAPPSMMFNTTSNNVTFNWTAEDDNNVTNTTFYLNGIANQTFLFGTGNKTNYQIYLNLSDGFYNWTADARDNTNKLTTATIRNFTVHTGFPTANITYPANATTFTIFTEYINLTINVSAFDAGTLDTCIFYNGTGGRNKTGTCGSNYTEGFFGGVHEIEYWINDSGGHEDSKNITFTVNAVKTNFTSVAGIIEGQLHNVTFSVTAVNTSAIYANVSYNSTIYPMTLTSANGTYTTFRKELTAPMVTADYTYNISVIYDLDGTIRTTTNNSQVVFNTPTIDLNATCSDGFNPLYIMSFADETTKGSLNVNLSYNFYYGTTGATEYLYGNISNTAKFSVCINKTIPYLYLSEGEIDYASGGYADRKYYLFEGYRYNGTNTNATLYSLTSASATSFLFTIQDNQFNVKPNKYLSLLRWYPELNAYNVVDMGKTDDKGQTVGRVKVEDVDYRIGIYEKNGSLIKLFNAIRFVCSSTPCTYSIFLPASTEDFVNVDNLQQTLVFNTASKIFTYTYNDVSQATSTMNLTVYKDAYGTSILVCANAASGFTGIITCNVSAYSGTLRAVVYRTASPAMPLISLIVQIGTRLVNIAGGKTIGMLMSFILFTFAFLAGIFSPVAALILGIVALIPAVYFGSITSVVFIGIILMTGILIHWLRRT